MLIQLYADEYKETKFIALAPGLVHTQMQEELAKVDTNKFTNIKRIHDARGTENMPTPEKFIGIYQKKIDTILSYESGSFIDIRKI
jgi:benzil reductase ((S)-benzoin forming)